MCDRIATFTPWGRLKKRSGTTEEVGANLTSTTCGRGIVNAQRAVRLTCDMGDEEMERRSGNRLAFVNRFDLVDHSLHCDHATLVR